MALSRILASMVNFAQRGIGAVARTLLDKLAEQVSVKDFGAKGNGTADDISAIDAAIAYVRGSGGGTVYFPVGIYGVRRKIKVPRGVVLRGAGGFDYSAYPSITGTVIKPLPGYSDPQVILADAAGDNTTLQSGNGFTDFAVDMDNISALGARALCLRSVTNFGPFRNVAVINMDHGIGLELDRAGTTNALATDGIDIVNFFTYGKTAGYVSTLARCIISNSVNEVNFRGCKFQSKSNAAAGTLAVQIYSGARGITFDGCSFAGCETGVSIFANNEANSAPEWIRFFSCTWEGYKVGIYIDSISSNAIFFPRRIHLDRSNRFITAVGANCRKVYANKIIDSYFSADNWIEASTSGTSYLFEITGAALDCVVEANPTQVLNYSTTTIVIGNTGGKLTAKLTREATTAPSLINGWAGGPASRQAVGYWKDAQGVVHLQGYLQSGTFGSGSGNAAFVLPVGYRPVSGAEFSVSSNVAAGGQPAKVLVAQDGTVYPLTGASYLCLDGITFPTD